MLFNAPLDVILADADVVQPDLVVAARTQISDRGVGDANLPYSSGREDDDVALVALWLH